MSCLAADGRDCGSTTLQDFFFKSISGFSPGNIQEVTKGSSCSHWKFCGRTIVFPTFPRAIPEVSSRNHWKLCSNNRVSIASWSYPLLLPVKLLLDTQSWFYFNFSFTNTWSGMGIQILKRSFRSFLSKWLWFGQKIGLLVVSPDWTDEGVL